MAEMWYVIWSHEHKMWWAPASRGYVENLEDAGLYSASEAMANVLRDVLHNEIAILLVTAQKFGHPKFHPYNGEVS